MTKDLTHAELLALCTKRGMELQRQANILTNRRIKIGVR